jgi:hypothetical protein
MALSPVDGSSTGPEPSPSPSAPHGQSCSAPATGTSTTARGAPPSAETAHPADDVVPAAGPACAPGDRLIAERSSARSTRRQLRGRHCGRALRGRSKRKSDHQRDARVPRVGGAPSDRSQVPRQHDSRSRRPPLGHLGRRRPCGRQCRMPRGAAAIAAQWTCSCCRSGAQAARGSVRCSGCGSQTQFCLRPRPSMGV